MAWPVNVSEETDPPESVEQIVTSSTDSLNQPPSGLHSFYVQSASGLTMSNDRRHSYPQNFFHTIEFRVPNPYISRIRSSRRYSTGDINQNNAQRASGINEINNGQRHFVQCCHINPNMRHSCCLHLNRHLSLESLNSHISLFPQNHIHNSYNPDTASGYAIGHTILNLCGQVPASENQTENGFGLNAEYERRYSFSVSNSFLFGNENFQADRNVQQAVSAVGPEFFIRFLAEEMDRQGLQLPENMCRDVDQSSEMPTSFIYLIDRFSASLEREMIYYLALRVQLPHSLSCFEAIVGGINNGNNNPERIVVLFFFCADLAMRALHEGNATLFHEIVSWTQWYLRRSGCLVGISSKRPSYKIAATVSCLVGIIGILFLIKNK